MPTKRNQDLLDLRHSSDKKASKPLMEKRRRARINHSLAQLKALVIDPNTTERSRQTKLEKADILELTVRHLHEIKRQQRTALLLESRHPKKRFEIGYSECVREVELFLSNLINPQNSAVDVELQKRLKDHLNKRLQDFRNIEPLEDISSKELSEEEKIIDELSSSPSSSVSNGVDDLPLPVDAEEANSADSSALNLMLKYYAGEEGMGKRKDSAAFSGENVHVKRLKDARSTPNEDEFGTSFSCSSVTSTTGYRSADSSIELSKPEKYDDVCTKSTISKTYAVKKSSDSHAIVSDSVATPHVICSSRGSDVVDRKPYVHACSNRKRTDITEYVASAECNIDYRNEQSKASSNQKIIEQIPLVPRQLANGDWALVLPASLVPTEKEDSYPFSAFRLVVPANSGSSEFDIDQMKQSTHPFSSPLSSTASDMSAEEYYSRSEGDIAERMEHGSPDSTQVVWRPW